MGHVVDQGINLARQLAHHRKRRHIQSNPSAGLQQRLVQLSATSHQVAWPIGRFHNESLLIQLAKNLSDNLAHALQRLNVVLALVELLGQLFLLLPHWKNTACFLGLYVLVWKNNNTILKKYSLTFFQTRLQLAMLHDHFSELLQSLHTCFFAHDDAFPKQYLKNCRKQSSALSDQEKKMRARFVLAENSEMTCRISIVTKKIRMMAVFYFSGTSRCCSYNL